MTMVSTLLSSLADVDTLNARLKMSNLERDLAYFVVQQRGEVSKHDDQLKYYKHLLLDQSLSSDVPA